MKIMIIAVIAIGLVSATSSIGLDDSYDANGNVVIDLMAKRHRHHRGGEVGSVSLERIVEPLKSKAEEIVRECGSRIVSTDHRGGVTPNHRNHRAVDITGNPSCIYAHLTDWPGGYSRDYYTAPAIRHVHISYCPPSSCRGGYEWGARFAHRGGSTVTLAARHRGPRRTLLAHYRPPSGRDFGLGGRI